MPPTDVTALDDLEPGVPHRVDVDGVPVCLVRVDDTTVKAVHDTCSHQEWSLADGGLVFGNGVECSLHGSTFDLDSGAPESLPAVRAVPVFPVTVTDGRVLIDVTAPTNDAPFPEH